MQPNASATSWFLLPSSALKASFNMAMDHALLEFAPKLGRPVLRFYSWSEAAASFGYFQKFAEIEKMTLLRPLVRRPTGGGLVPHDADWTYSVVFPPTDAWYELKAIESYERIHEWIRAAFQKLGVTTKLAPTARKALPGQCFEGYEQFDVLWQGRKIAGAAQRRTRDGLLIQGSVQPPPIKISRADWEQAMCEVGKSEQNISWQIFDADRAFIDRVTELTQKTYLASTYNQRR